MDTKEICILVVNDDLTCNNVLSEMLQHCNYHVLHVGNILDVLNAIWETKDSLDLVLTNGHKLESNGMVIVQHIQNKLHLPVILMCADKRKILSNGQPLNFAAYVLKGLSRSDANNLWQRALERERDKMVSACDQSRDVEKAKVVSKVASEANKTSATTSETTWFNNQKRKRKLCNERGGGVDEDRPVSKKPRVVWTREMHQKFLEAIEIIGYEKAVPKKIVEVMGIPSLTRENVASHLQKFRGTARRTHETPKESIDTIKPQYLNTINGVSFETISDRKNYKNVQGYQTRSAFLNNGLRGDHNNQCKFVGYRLNNEGNSIRFGVIEESNNDQDTCIQSINDKHTNCFPIQDSMACSQMAQSFDNFLDEFMVNGGEINCSQLAWDDFDDFLFEQDD